MNENSIAGYVRTQYGDYLVQLPANNVWGFTLHSDDQSWPGGFGFTEWELVSVHDVPETDRERLDWLFSESGVTPYGEPC